jgi:hypothetical protein
MDASGGQATFLVFGCTDSGKSFTIGTLKKSFQPENNALIQNLAVDLYDDPVNCYSVSIVDAAEKNTMHFDRSKRSNKN